MIPVEEVREDRCLELPELLVSISIHVMRALNSFIECEIATVTFIYILLPLNYLIIQF